RGAKAADGTGDGAGLLTQIPLRLIHRDLAAAGVTIDPSRELGVVVCFFPPDRAEELRSLVEEAVAAERASVAFWRTVPIGPSVPSARARESLPVIQQAVVVAPPGVQGDEFERLLFLARKRIEREATSEDFSIPSASSRTVVYKGLFTAADIAAFYWDLADPRSEERRVGKEGRARGAR